MDPLALPLTQEEFEALRKVPRSVITNIMRDRLIELGLVAQKLGGLARTRDGDMRARKGRWPSAGYGTTPLETSRPNALIPKRSRPERFGR